MDAMAKLQAYLRETLGIDVHVEAWGPASTLPYFLQDAFDVRQLDLLGRAVLLAFDRQANGERRPTRIRAGIDEIQKAAGLPVIYVTDALASWERKRLIEQKVPFLVPGNQLYLPDLGIDLREYFRRHPMVGDAAMSPATQAMLIAVLLRRPWCEEWSPASVAHALGYTAMTQSRAVRELASAGLCTLEARGRSRWVRMDQGPAAIWEKAQAVLRTPVTRRVWARTAPPSPPERPRLAGLSALARYSMLAEPRLPVFAVSARQWRESLKAGTEMLPEPLAGACEWEIWQYSPALAPAGETVDPLSLWLSLRNSPDERVLLALDALKERFPW